MIYITSTVAKWKLKRIHGTSQSFDEVNFVRVFVLFIVMSFLVAFDLVIPLATNFGKLVPLYQ